MPGARWIICARPKWCAWTATTLPMELPSVVGRLPAPVVGTRVRGHVARWNDGDGGTHGRHDKCGEQHDLTGTEKALHGRFLPWRWRRLCHLFPFNSNDCPYSLGPDFLLLHAERVQLRMRPIGPSTPFSGTSLIRSANFNPACKKRVPVDDGRRPGSMRMESGALQQPLNTQWRYGDQSLRTERSSAVERLFQQPHGGRR